VNWVRDRQDADVHVLGTSQRTGSGGREYTLSFIGLRRFDGRADTLRFTTSRTDTDAEARDALTRTLSLGLVAYAAATPLASHLSVGFTPSDGARPETPAEDPWNFWVFRVRASGSLEGESQQNEQGVNGGISASRVTKASKIDLGASGRYRRSAFVLDDSTEYVDVTHSWDTEGIAVWSLGPHWSAGVRGEVSSSTFYNRDLQIIAGPALEYSVFPYEESTRRVLTFQLSTAVAYDNYEVPTIFDRLSEVHPVHVLDVAFTQRQPWGNVRTSVSWWQYWHDLARHRVELFGGTEVRLFRGLSFNVFASFARVKDQLYLPKEDLSPEEILLQRRQLGTDHRYDVSVGFSYTFGSIYNNVVNPRIEN
jgi:hypothetical protein